ncbi:MAG: cyclase family protein [Deltaproteobacteria bacterium]|jgi:kynurenine formamidase|nr:cyclase family protein [Deltaproteobacteria bacterium]
MPVIDLSYPLADTTVVLPGHPRPVYEWLKTIVTKGCNHTVIKIGVHAGTHADAPLHFLQGGASNDNVPLEHFWGRAGIFRSKVPPPAGREITAAEVKESGFELSGAKIFVPDTGISAYAGTRDYNEKFAVPGEDLVDWPLGRGGLTFMTDATSVDPGISRENPRHKQLFKKGAAVV